jgi:amino acid transporter/nucleotide-binding universal stress UspA family protein
LNHSNSPTDKSNLVRELGLKEGLSIGLGTMIGAGIFVLSALAAERAGPASALSYVLAGAICLPIAFVVSELATGMPKAGGSYTFITEALGPLAGSVVGPGNWLGLTFASGFYLLACGEYLAIILPAPPWVFSLAVGLLFTWMNYRGAKLTGGVQNIVVIILVVILGLFIGIGIFEVDTNLYQPFAPNGWGAVAGTVGLIIVSFTGFEKISTISEEMKQPGRNLPLAIVGSVIIATLIYAAILIVLTGIFPRVGIAQREAPLVEAAGQMVGPIGTAVMLGAAILATLSSANAAIMASSRINYGMGRDGILPVWFSYIHPKHNTPSYAIVVTGILGILLSLTGHAEALAEISSALFMVSYALLCLSVIVMRQSRPIWYHPVFRVPLYPVLPIVGGLLCLSVIFTMAPSSRVAGLALVTASLIWYVIWVRKQARVEGEISPLWERERPLEGMIEAAQVAVRADGHEIVIPILKGSASDHLLPLAARLAQTDDRRTIVVLEIGLVPSQTPLAIGETRLAKEGIKENSAVGRLIRQGADLGVPIRPLRRAARAEASGVLAIVNDRPTVEMVLLNWRGPLSAGQIYESPSKAILQEALCDVAVLRERSLSDIKRILVPAGGGPHARLGLRMAIQLASDEDTQVTLMRIARPHEELNIEAEVRALNHLSEEVLGGVDPRVNTKIIVENSVVDGILNEAKKGQYDLLIVGASNEWQVKSLLVGAIPDTIADRAPCSVLMVRRYEAPSVSNVRRILHSLRGW